LTEIKLLIENAKNCTGVLASDHIINLLQEIQGRLDADREKMLAIIEDYFSLTKAKQRIFQLARRSGWVVSPAELELLPPERLEKLARIAGAVENEAQWDKKINEMMAGFI